KQLDAGHDHAGRTIPALQPMAFPETFLDRVQLAVFGQAFDGSDFGAIRLNGENGAGFDGRAIQKHSACAADARFTSNMCAGEIAMVAQKMHQEHPWLDLVLPLDPVDFDRNETFHIASK